MELLLFPVAWLLCGGLGAALAHRAGRAWEGLVLGMLLGPIGAIGAAFLRPTRAELARRAREEARARADAQLEERAERARRGRH